VLRGLCQGGPRPLGGGGSAGCAPSLDPLVNLCFILYCMNLKLSKVLFIAYTSITSGSRGREALCPLLMT